MPLALLLGGGGASKILNRGPPVYNVTPLGAVKLYFALRTHVILLRISVLIGDYSCLQYLHWIFTMQTIKNILNKSGMALVSFW